jgi:hypothetical protein
MQGASAHPTIYRTTTATFVNPIAIGHVFNVHRLGTILR